MKNVELQAGDLVFFYTGNSLFDNIQRAVNQPVGHVGVFYDLVKNSKGKLVARIMEEMSEGLVMNEYDIENRDDIAVMRHKIKIDTLKMKWTMWSCYSETYQKVAANYSYVGLVDAAANALLDFATFGLWEKHRLLPGEQQMFCSEFAAFVYERYGLPIKVETNEVITPTDEYRCGDFTLIKSFGGGRQV